ncbi:hypothetical protein AB0J80_29505 [Actinoplanes sp. NPDC049548]|uniref:hypothetical protein n=1 Tax=Actinoplanes sp. NPDC049548 TaxID=3155152 RepID=UPI00343A7F94
MQKSLDAAMATARFWRTYAFDGDFEQEGELLEEELGDDLRIYLPVGGRYRLRLEPSFGLALHVLNLVVLEEYEDEDDDGWAYEIGHWDQARWHPWCLRREEASAVAAFMRAHPGDHGLENGCTVSPDLAELLLSRFVGHATDDAAGLAAHRAEVAGRFLRMGLFDAAEAERVAESMVRTPPDRYAWTRSQTHGWLFGGDYGCYSNRDLGHSHFPFDDFAAFRAMLGLDAR